MFWGPLFVTRLRTAMVMVNADTQTDFVHSYFCVPFSYGSM